MLSAEVSELRDQVFKNLKNSRDAFSVLKFVACINTIPLFDS